MQMLFLRPLIHYMRCNVAVPPKFLNLYPQATKTLLSLTAIVPWLSEHISRSLLSEEKSQLQKEGKKKFIII